MAISEIQLVAFDVARRIPVSLCMYTNVIKVQLSTCTQLRHQMPIRCFTAIDLLVRCCIVLPIRYSRRDCTCTYIFSTSIQLRHKMPIASNPPVRRYIVLHIRFSPRRLLRTQFHKVYTRVRRTARIQSP